MEVCDMHVLLIQNGELYVFDVNAAHNLNYAGSVHLQIWSCCLACTRRENDTLVAFAHDSSVSLQRLASIPLRLKPLARLTSLTAPWRLLFREELLLVADMDWTTNTHAIVSVRTTGNALTELRVLLDAQKSVYVFDLTLAGDRLVLAEKNLETFEYKAGNLFVYVFV